MGPTSQESSAEPLATSTAIIEPLDISFGVEFEFILIERFPEDEAWADKTLQQKVYYGLSQVGEILKAMLFTCGSCGTQFQMPIAVQDASEDWKANHEQWNVQADDSMKLTRDQRRKLLALDDNCDALGVEVTSRKFFADRDVPVGEGSPTDHRHTINYKEEIETILGALHRAYNSPAAATDGVITRWLVINNTCDLHVHVGNDNKGFPLQTVKNVMSLCTAFERVIDSMHSHSRIRGTSLALAPLDALDEVLGTGPLSGDQAVKTLPITQQGQHEYPMVPLTEHLIARAWCQRRTTAHQPPSPSTPNSSAPPTPTHPSPSHTASNPHLAQATSGLYNTAFLENIQSAPNLDSLINLAELKQSTVSLLYLKNWSSLAKTIEFRQHAAVTSAAETLPWIDFVTSLVAAAHESSAERVLRFCARAAENPDLTIEGLLDFLPMREEGDFVYYLDRMIDAGRRFFDHDAARAEVEAVLGDAGDERLRKVALELVEERKAEYDPGVVGNAVRGKFEAGGYGQFSRKFIDVYAPGLSEEDKVKLTIGWEAPVDGPVSEYGDESEYGSGSEPGPESGPESEPEKEPQHKANELSLRTL